MTKRAEIITRYYQRLSILDKESDKYEEVYRAFKAFLNSQYGIFNETK